VHGEHWAARHQRAVYTLLRPLRGVHTHRRCTPLPADDAMKRWALLAHRKVPTHFFSLGRASSGRADVETTRQWVGEVVENLWCSFSGRSWNDENSNILFVFYLSGSSNKEGDESPPSGECALLCVEEVPISDELEFECRRRHRATREALPLSSSNSKVCPLPWRVNTTAWPESRFDMQMNGADLFPPLFLCASYNYIVLELSSKRPT